MCLMEHLTKVLRAAAPDAGTALVEWIFSKIATDPRWKAMWKGGSAQAAIRSIDAAEHEVLAALLQRKSRPLM